MTSPQHNILVPPDALMESVSAKINRGIANGGLYVPKNTDLHGWFVEEDDCGRSVNRTMEILVVSYVPVILFPILTLLCTVGNLVNFWILFRHCRAGAKQVFLLSLAISDMLAMWTTLPIYLNLNNHILGLDLSKNPFLISSFGVFTWLQYTFCYVSDWILVAFSVERLTAFRFNKPRPQTTGVRVPAIALVCVIVLSAGIMTSGTLIWYYHWWVNREAGKSYFQPEWVAQWVRLRQQIDIMCPILVTLILLATNLWLLTYLKRQLKLSKSLMANSLAVESGPPKASTRHDNLTRMLLGCVALYCFTQIPAVTLNTLDHLSNAPYCLFPLPSKSYWEPVIYTLALMNYSSNFLVYVSTSARYRRVVQRAVRRSCHAASTRYRRTSTSSASGSTNNGTLLHLRPFSWARSRAGSGVSF